MSWVKFKTQEKLNSQCSGTKKTKLKGIAKLDDANDAGTTKSQNCTLILTEGDSAKTLAISGLGVVGRDKYGVFPLRGKLLNVREATSKQVINRLPLLIYIAVKVYFNLFSDLSISSLIVTDKCCLKIPCCNRTVFLPQNELQHVFVSAITTIL